MNAPPDADLRSARDRALGMRAIVQRMAALLRVARIHASENQALRTAAADFHERVEAAAHVLGVVEVSVGEGAVRVNGALVGEASGPSQSTDMKLVAEEFDRREIGSIRLHAGVSVPDLLALVAAFRLEEGRGAAERVDARLGALGVGAVQVVDRADAEPQGDDLGAETSDALDAYVALLTIGERIEAARGKLPSDLPGPARAAVQHACDVAERAPDILLFLASYSDAERYGAVHAANMSALSVLLGRRLGLGADALVALGTGALLADLGMGAVAGTLRSSASELPRGDAEAVMRHPIGTFGELLTGGSFDAVHRATLAIAWEHHCGVDGDGYPGPAPDAGPHLFARIAAIADAYDALVHDRGDRAALARPLALEALFRERGRRYDEALLTSFFSMMGRYPPGSLVMLRERVPAVVIRAARDPRLFDRPEVVVFRDASKRRLQRPVFVDLATQRADRATRIDAVLDPRRFDEPLIAMVLRKFG